MEKLVQHIFNFWHIIDIVLKLVLAVLCGGLVGLIKNGDKNTISFSTLILTCFTSAFLVLVIMKLNISMYSIEISTAAVLIGFSILCGSIIIGKQASLHSIINGLTIWAVAGMGIAIGTGLFIVGIIAGLIMSVLLNIIYSKLLINSE